MGLCHDLQCLLCVFGEFVIGLQPIKTRAKLDSSTNILRVSPVNEFAVWFINGFQFVVGVSTGFQNLVHPSGFSDRFCVLAEIPPRIALGVFQDLVVLLVALSESEPRSICFLTAGCSELASYTPLSFPNFTS